MSHSRGFKTEPWFQCAADDLLVRSLGFVRPIEPRPILPIIAAMGGRKLLLNSGIQDGPQPELPPLIWRDLRTASTLTSVKLDPVLDPGSKWT
jgi:hypothetical protein